MPEIEAVIGLATPLSPLLIRGGQVHLSGMKSDAAISEIRTEVGQLIQCNQVAVLIGAGASFHLDGPRIRNADLAFVESLLSRTAVALDDAEKELLGALLGDTTRNLEDFLSQLGSIARMSGGPAAVKVAGIADATAAARSLRSKITVALCRACDLPGPGVAPEYSANPWKAHRAFFRRLVDARRFEMSRLRVFTTNYDVAIERALDAEGIRYADGFAGTITRVFRPETYRHDVVVRTASDSTPIGDFLYLYKIHGSIDWRFEKDTAASQLTQTWKPTSDQESAVVYPTTEKEADTLGYPYSSLLHHFAASLAAPESALITIGYGFGDRHINRIIEGALASGSDFQLLVFAPTDVLEIIDKDLADESTFDIPTSTEAAVGRWKKTGVGSIAQMKLPRVQVITGRAAMFTRCADELLPAPQPVRPTEVDTAAEVRSAFARVTAR